MKENRSSEVVSDLGPTEKHVKVEKAAPWSFLWWSGTIPVHLTFNESRKDFSVRNNFYISHKNQNFLRYMIFGPELLGYKTKRIWFLLVTVDRQYI